VRENATVAIVYLVLVACDADAGTGIAGGAVPPSVPVDRTGGVDPADAASTSGDAPDAEPATTSGGGAAGAGGTSGDGPESRSSDGVEWTTDIASETSTSGAWIETSTGDVAQEGTSGTSSGSTDTSGSEGSTTEGSSTALADEAGSSTSSGSGGDGGEASSDDGPIAVGCEPPGTPETGSSSGDGSDADTAGTPPVCGNGIVEPPESCWTEAIDLPGTGNELTGVVVADFTNDGDDDIALLSYQSAQNSPGNPVTVLVGSENASFTVGSVTSLGLMGGARGGAGAADFDQDGLLDLAFVDQDDPGGAFDHPYLRIWTGDGDGTFTSVLALPFPAPSELRAVVGELDGDGLPDVLTYFPHWDAYSEVEALLWPGTGDGDLGAPIVAFDPTGLDHVAVARIDCDDIDDLVVRRTSGTAILLADGDGSFTEVPGAPGCSPNHRLVGDFDGDAIVDMACRSSGAATVHLGHGDGTFEPGTTTLFPGLSAPDCPADHDGDGIDDVLVAYAPTVYVARGLGDGTFAAAEAAFDLPVYAVWGDPHPLNCFGRPRLDANGDGVDDVLQIHVAGPPYTVVNPYFEVSIYASDP
jgi:hypothetical protein